MELSLLFGEDAAFVEEAGNVDMIGGSGQVMAHRPPTVVRKILRTSTIFWCSVQKCFHKGSKE
jgi:hypothetical protein